MKTIWKYPLATLDVQAVTGNGIRVISAGLDPEGRLCVWAKVDSDQPVSIAHVAIVGTGRELPVENFEFLASVRVNSFMWHIFTMHDDRIAGR
jgi:hypothetical protein